MKLKLKEIKLGAGRPIAFINEENAKSLNLHIGDRVEITFDSKHLIALADIVKGFIGKGEIALSDEIVSFFNLKEGDTINIALTIEPRSTRYIAKKLNGKKLEKEEIYCIVNDIINNALTEAEIAYFVSGVYEHGMSIHETIYLTEAMYKTGKIIDWHSKEIVDKHSIGGIAGNRTTPIVISICAAAGLIMPKTSSRAITSPAGTADVIETIANVDLSVEKLKEIVRKTGACMAWGGSLGLAPVDDKLIRVERLLNLDPESQLIASIMAKKLAVGSKYILIDIPYGKNAKVTKSKAKNLAKKFMKVSKHFHLKTKIILTDGSQPIGNGIGPVLEMRDVISVLKRENSPQDLEKKAIMLSGMILEMTGKAKKGKGILLAKEILDSGKALKKFEEIIAEQGRKLNGLQTAKFTKEIKSEKSGKIIYINNKAINLIGRILGCPADKGAGIYLFKHNKDKISKKETLMTFYSESEKKLKEALDFCRKSKVILIK